MSKKTNLVKKLIRQAHANPDQQKKLMAVIEAGLRKEGSVEKVAINKETEDFGEWAANQDPMSPSEVESFVKRQAGIKTSPPVKKRTGLRFQEGDQVKVVASKHKYAASQGPYDQFDGKIGTVAKLDGATSILVAFKGEPAPIRFDNAQRSRGVGLGKYTAPYVIQGSAKIEMIYHAAKPAKPDAVITVQIYLGRGKGTEKRRADYYTGHITFAASGADGGYYFKMAPQQRQTIGGEGGYEFRGFSPAKGKVFYIGLFGKRPPHWKKELEDLKAESAEG